jgi:hypothetical protein
MASVCRPRMSELKPWLTRKAAALYLESVGCPISPQTLANLAANNNARKGPPFKKVRQRIVRYHVSDLQAWAIGNARMVGK